MATSSVASSSVGLDVPGLVAQLMAVERQPIDKLNTRVASYQTKISSFGTISGLVSGFQTALQSLKTSSLGFSATSSDTSILSASAGSTAAVGTYALNVTQLAQAQSLVAAGQADTTTAIGSGNATVVTFDFGTTNGATFTPNGGGTKSITIDGTNNTLQGISDAINAAQMGVSATIVNDGSGTPYRLALTSTNSGVSNSIKVTTDAADATVAGFLTHDPAGAQNLTQTVAAQDANFTVNGIALSNASNTITDAIQGVSLTLTKLTTTPATLTVTRDTSAVSTAVSGFIDAYNALASQLKSRSAYGSATAQGGALAGDGTLRLMQDQLRGIFNTAASGGTLTYLSEVGVAFQADGTLKLDSSKLNSAMASNFSDVTNLFSSATGFATRLDAWATSALSPGDGLIATRTDSLNLSIKDYNDQLGKLEARMAALQKRYTATYSNLNMLLISMNGTSSYLSQQLSNGA